MPAARVRETELYAPIRDYLVAQGYTVRSEVRGCDITATRNDELIVVELKCGFSTGLLIQATERQRVADAVYVALPRPPASLDGRRWRGIRHLLRRLELGLLLVSFSMPQPTVDVAFHPLPFDRRRNSKGRHTILREIAGRSGEYNVGGSTGSKIVTAYRESALFIACCLDARGPLTPAALRALGTGPKTLSILCKNVYNWFERQDRGLYGLRAEGRSALAEYPELAAHYRTVIENLENKASQK